MGWSDKYKRSIDCNNPKGFSQKAHCAGRKIRKENMKLSELKEVIRDLIQERSVNAISKAQGEKVKDDVTLLKKSIKKQKQIKTSSKKKWDKRAEDVKSKESAFVEKREGNLNKRIKEKKEKKIKKLVAKGRHVPGFGS